MIWVRLTTEGGEALFVNPYKIISIGPRNYQKISSVLHLDGGSSHFVREAPDEVVRLAAEAEHAFDF